MEQLLLVLALLLATADALLPPCAGIAATPGRAIIVVGTAHTPSAKQLREVEALVKEQRPDVVLLELDQERLDRLLQTDADARSFGAEFVAAAEAAVECGAVLLLGDVPAREFWRSVISFDQPLADVRRLQRAGRLALQGSPRGDVELSRVSVPAALVDDPSKLLSIAASILATVGGVAAVSAAGVLHATPSSLTELGGTCTTPLALLSYAVLALSCAALVRVVDVLLLSRDEALAAAAIRAIELGEGLRSGSLLRRTFSFETDEARLKAARAATPRPPGSTPFFTLRTPLGANETRRLNLFEPRWLSLMDELSDEPVDGGTAAAARAPGVDGGKARSGGLVGAQFGTLLASNRLYMPRASESGTGRGRRGTRTADLVVSRQARMVRVCRAEEGLRPVSRARKLSVWIRAEGGAQEVEASSLQPTGGGYLAGHLVAAGDAGVPARARGGGAALGSGVQGVQGVQAVKVLCVVGLAHANGVLDRCAADL
jgi:hypothetical protein